MTYKVTPETRRKPYMHDVDPMENEYKGFAMQRQTIRFQCKKIDRP